MDVRLEVEGGEGGYWVVFVRFLLYIIFSRGKG